jgi:hypothetical protein
VLQLTNRLSGGGDIGFKPCAITFQDVFYPLQLGMKENLQKKRPVFPRPNSKESGSKLVMLPDGWQDLSGQLQI